MCPILLHIVYPNAIYIIHGHISREAQINYRHDPVEIFHELNLETMQLLMYIIIFSPFNPIIAVSRAIRNSNSVSVFAAISKKSQDLTRISMICST